MSIVRDQTEPGQRRPLFLFLFTNRTFLVTLALAWLLFWIGFSVHKSDWMWFARSGSVLGIIGGILTSRPVLRLTQAERVRIRNMNLVECFTPSELEDQERDSSAIVIGVILLLFGTLIWAYGDLLPKLWHAA
jgi:hypothetical protein